VSVRWRKWGKLALLVLVVAGLVVWRVCVTRPAYRLARGQESIRAGDLEQAKYYADKLEAAGHSDEAHLLRGEYYYARKRPDLALSEFDAIEDTGSLQLQAAAKVGRCLLDLGDLKEAYRAFSYVVEQQPDHADAHRGLAAIAYDLGQFGSAVAHLEVVARVDPADGRPHRLIGLIYKDMGQHAKAQSAYREALRRGLPAEIAEEVRRELAQSYLEIGQFADALSALGDEPAEDADAVAARALALRGVGRSAEALDLIDRNIARTRSALLYRIRGQLALDAGDDASAISWLEKATDISPTDYRAHFLLGKAYSGAGRVNDAKRVGARADELRRDLDKITKLSGEAMDRPWDGAVRLELAELSERLGMPEVAKMWRKAAAFCQGKPR
jgi:tetratricopeptide (TPR) repeat protein